MSPLDRVYRIDLNSHAKGFEYMVLVVAGVSGVGAPHTTPMSHATRRLALLPLQ